MVDRGIWALVIVCGATACAPPLQGTWFGRLTCGQLIFDTTLTLDRAEGEATLGTGELVREFEDSQRNDWVSEERIGFDVRITPSEDDDTELRNRWTCTSDVLTEYKTNRSDPEVFDRGCDDDRFEDYAIAWDGADVFTVSAPDTCGGTLTYRGR